MPTRIDLDAAANEPRKTIDASWTPRQKKLVSAACVVAAVGALAGGVYAAITMRPLGLPTTAEQAIAGLASEKFQEMDPERRAQYAAEAQRLIRELPDDQRRAMMRDDENRDAMRALMEERMEDMARRFARGEEPQMPWGPPDGMRRPGMGPGGPGGERPPGREGGPGREGQGREGQGRDGQRQMTDAERAQRTEERRQRVEQAMARRINTGNAQSTGLMTEMRKRMMQERAANPGSGGNNNQQQRRPGGG